MSSSANFAGLAIGMALTVVHLFGIPLTGTSVNPARSLGPALIVRGDAISQVWLFIVAPLVGGAIAALGAPVRLVRGARRGRARSRVGSSPRTSSSRSPVQSGGRSLGGAGIERGRSREPGLDDSDSSAAAQLS